MVRPLAGLQANKMQDRLLSNTPDDPSSQLRDRLGLIIVPYQVDENTASLAGSGFAAKRLDEHASPLFYHMQSIHKGQNTVLLSTEM